MSMDMFGLEEDPEREPELDTEREPEPDDEDREDLMPAPRTIDAATWAARGIVVLTLGLVAVLGGLFLGVSVTDSTPAAAKPTTTTSSTTAPEPTETASETEIARVNAPPVKVSAAGPDGPQATTSVRVAGVATTPATVIGAPTSSAPSPTSTAAPRGKSTNTGKPKPTKP